MALVKTGKAGGDIRFGYNQAGELVGLLVPIDIQITDNGTNPPTMEAEASRLVDIWGKLTQAQQQQARTLVKKAKELAELEI